MPHVEWLEPSAALARLVTYQQGARAFHAVVVKLAVSLEHASTAKLIAPADWVAVERHLDKDIARSIAQPSDLAPRKEQVDLVLTGHAYAPGGRPVEAHAVRFAVFGPKGALFDRTLHVLGDRKAGERPRPFVRMPLVWERALGGPGTDNPLGGQHPNLLDPANPSRPGCFGPLSRFWPAARRALGTASRKGADASSPSLPDDFRFEYYQCAPEAQRVASLTGDEWIVLDGLHPALPRLQTQLPGLAPQVMVFDAAGRQAPLGLTLDTCFVDVDQQTATLLFRGSLDVTGIARSESLRYIAGLARRGATLSWPTVPPLADAAGQAPSPPATDAPRTAGDDDLGHTIAGGGVGVDLPFLRAGVPAPRASAPPPAGAPRSLERTTLPQGPVPSAPLPFVGPSPGAPMRSSEGLPFGGGPLPSPPRPESDNEPTRTIALGGLLAAVPPALSPWASQPSLSIDPVPPPPQAASPAPPPLSPWANPGPPPLASAPALPFVAPAPPAVAPPRSAPPATPPPAMVSPPDAGPATDEETADAPAHAPPPVAAAPPKRPPRMRDGALIPSVVQGPLHVASIAWQVKPPQDSLTVIVKGTFRIQPDGPLVPAGEGEVCTGDIPAGDDPLSHLLTASDFAIFKPRADVLLVGHAYAPREVAGRRGLGAHTAAQVELRFGEGGRGFVRKIAAFGDREWKRSLVVTGPGDPRPFDKIPLTWDRAWGGAGYDANPAGVGYQAATSQDGVARLPNLEDPAQLVAGPGATPEPACPGPVATQWKERWSKLGTYDRAWFRTRWPYFPDDFDYAFFQAAPRRQQLEHLTGDEAFSVSGVHPDHPRIDGRLPGVRARCFLEPGVDPEVPAQPFREVRLVLDTVVLDTDRMQATLTWRGLLDVSDPEAPEIGVMFALLEPLAGPSLSLAEAREAYLAAAAPPEPADEPELEPEDPATVAEPDPEAERIDAMIAEREAAMQKALDDAGVASEPTEPPPPPDPERIAASLRAAGADEADVEAVLEALRATDEPPPMPAPDPDARAKVAAALSAGESLDGVELVEADLHGMDLSGASLRGADLRRARLVGAKLDGAALEGALLVEAELTDASLKGCDLRGVDATRASLVGADLSGARIDGARFSEARAELAKFSQVMGAKAEFVRAELADARFDGAVLPDLELSEAKLDRATFDGARLEQVRLYFASGQRASFVGAVLEGARAEAARLPECSFEGARAPSSVWEGAKLQGSTFLRAELAGAAFTRAKLARTVFSGADLREARMRRADLSHASLLKADLTSADLERANLEGADLRGACLHEAELWLAKTPSTKLDHALVTQTKLARKA